MVKVAIVLGNLLWLRGMKSGIFLLIPLLEPHERSEKIVNIEYDLVLLATS
jgi:hypothetical protein